MAKSAYVKVSSPANIGGVMTECQVTVKSYPESNNFVRYRYRSITAENMEKSQNQTGLKLAVDEGVRMITAGTKRGR